MSKNPPKQPVPEGFKVCLRVGCSSSGVPQPAVNFYKKISAKDGLQSYCKACSHVKSSQWAKKNPEKSRAIIRHAVARHYKENAQETLRKKRQYYKDNPAKRAVFERARRAQKQGTPGICTAAQMQVRAEMYGERCAYCPGLWEHDDHVIPLQPRPGEPKGANWPANMRPACAPCNTSKGNKPLKVWLSERSALQGMLIASPAEPTLLNAQLQQDPARLDRMIEAVTTDES